MATVVMWDVDGVLANFNKAYLELANEMFARGFDVNRKPETWDELEDKIGSEKVGQMWKRIKADAYFWQDLEPLVTPQEVARIGRLNDSRLVTQYFVTSRPGFDTHGQTEKWLCKKLQVGNPTVIVSSRKAEAANALAANYTIDDKAGNVLAVYYNSPRDRHVYVLDTPYNRFSPKLVGSGVRRVMTVSDFLADVEKDI